MTIAATRRRPGLGTRLLIAQTTVLLAGAVTTWLVAAIVGPPLFREHLHMAGVSAGSAEQFHAEEAYLYATMLAVGGAVAVSAITAFTVTWYVSRRLQRSLTEVAEAARAVSAHRYDVRVAPQHLGDDFDTLTGAFNHMAAQLQAIDTTRRQLFSDLAHEIRTPVAVLEACMEAVEDGVRTLTPDTTAMLRDQTQRLVRFAEDLGALARAEESAASMTYTQTDVHDLVTTTVTALAERFDAKGVGLSARSSVPPPTLLADRQRLTQVLTNLLDNALRHTPTGGHVDVDIQSLDNQLVLIDVRDTGDGISAEHLPHVFERFYRADPSRARDHGGAGLGLAIAKALVEAHNGQISAHSDGIGAGTTFTVALPIPLPHPNAHLDEMRPLPQAPGRPADT